MLSQSVVWLVSLNKRDGEWIEGFCFGFKKARQSESTNGVGYFVWGEVT